MLWFSSKLGSQLRILGGYANGTSIQMAFAHHRAAHHNQGSRTETEFVGAQKSCYNDIEAGPQLTVRLQNNPRRVNAMSR